MFLHVTLLYSDVYTIAPGGFMLHPRYGKMVKRALQYCANSTYCTKQLSQNKSHAIRTRTKHHTEVFTQYPWPKTRCWRCLGSCRCYPFTSVQHVIDVLEEMATMMHLFFHRFFFCIIRTDTTSVTAHCAYAKKFTQTEEVRSSMIIHT